MKRIHPNRCRRAALTVLLSVFSAVTLPASAPRSPQQTANTKPTLHFRPQDAKAGDVIPFYWKGDYHLFYLKGPDWAHVVSRDLLRWQELPNALIKGSDPLGPDWESIWTGSVVEHGGTFYLFYTGKNSNDPLGDQKVMQARSVDLIHWTKHPEYTFYADGKIYWNKTINGAIDDKQIYHHQAFRDPHVVWNGRENRWWLALHAMLADGSAPNVGLYTSRDLTHWTPHAPLVVYPASVSGDCPDLFELNGLWNVNCADYHYMQVRDTGAIDPPVQPYDCGDLRVAKTMSDGKRRILIGWIGDYKNDSDAGEYEWGGTLSMPRELYADAAGQLYQRPVREVVRLFDRTALREKRVGLNTRYDLPENYMLTATLFPQSGFGQATLRFRESADRTEGYSLTVDFQTGEIGIGSRYRTFQRKCGIDPYAPLKIRLFVDGTIAECFVNDAYCFTMRIYDSLGTGVSFRSTAPGLTVKDLVVRVRE